MERNPYAPSRATLESGTSSAHAATTGIWRDGSVLVMHPMAPLPHRCVKCNEAADQPTAERKVYWHHPGIYALILLNLIIYAIVAAIVRKRAIVAPGLCVQHKRRRRNALLVGWGGFALGIALFFAAGATESENGPMLVLAGIVSILAGIVWGIAFARVVYAKRIDELHVRLGGCGAAFLDSLPPFTR